MLPHKLSCYHTNYHVTTQIIMLPQKLSCYHKNYHVTTQIIMLPHKLSCYHTNDHVTTQIIMLPHKFLTILPINPLKPELNPICYLLALLGAHHFLHVSRIRVKLLTFRLLMSYIYGAPILDVSRSHTTTQHSR